MRNTALVAILLPRVFLFIWLCTVSVSAQVILRPEIKAKERAARQASPDWKASVAVAKKVEAGDKQALNELAGMDPVVAVPLLAGYAKDRSTDAEAAAIALTALKKVRGIRDYFRARIAYLHAQPGGGFDNQREFNTLALIATKEAAAAAAPFLFDNSELDEFEHGSDYSVGASLRYQALCAMMDTKLPNAPTNKSSYEANDEDIKKWREWWLAHKAEYEN